MTGFTIKDGISTTEPSGWVVESRLGLTADRLRVVDYGDTEAAFLFRAPGKKVTVAESEQYGISAAHPTSPRPWPAAPVVVPEVKIAAPVEDKMVRLQENKSIDLKKKARR